MSTQNPSTAHSLADLHDRDTFESRHIGPPDSERQQMLDVIGVESIEELVDRTVPDDIRMSEALDLPEPVGQLDAQVELKSIAETNQPVVSLIGMGYHETVTPPVIRRNIMENPGWYTAYTPYQPEISQGRLEALLNFQTMVIELSGMEVANASLLDEPTAVAESMTMLQRVNRKNEGTKFIIDRGCHPQTIAVVETRAKPIDITTVVDDPLTADLEGVFGLVVQYPATTGAITDLGAIINRAHQADVLVAVSADPLALAVLTPPGELGADVVVGSTQRFGVPMGFGGPHAAYFATREQFQRSLPGRVVGVSVDVHNKPALRLALQTREQHIRREKATSNICTSQVLLAVMASFFAIYHGPRGLRGIADRVNRLAAIVAEGLRRGGVEIVHDEFFDTVCARVPGRADKVMAMALASGVNLRRVDENTVAASLDQRTSRGIIETIWQSFGIAADLDEIEAVVADPRPKALRRTSPVLRHPIFKSYHSETELVRYMRRLVNRDIALDRSMIPLGSCTMKLNAATEMEPISWPEFASLHPFAPVQQTVGYHRMIDQLERWLVEITGYDRVSLQPNSGAQGE
ncbi:MAG: glycine dehydrogenase (aminomethyl-transferring), partial [Acidimicrobiaceae bacterium]|nr:glycine dehydrogenase (aminomethyl-transferring) [Acidimicrobiaceae bacterium]